MSTKAPSAFEQAISQIPTCALDQEGIQAQQARYAQLGPDVRRILREPVAVVIEFRQGFDRETLEEALAVERECCPFFIFDIDEHSCRLRTTVREREQLPALEAMVYSLDGARRARAQD